MYSKVVKRFIDIVLSLLALIILIPVWIILAIVIKIDSPGPILFKQKRVGKGKKYFKILKYRTMYADTPQDIPTHLLKDPSAKITKIGAFLRRTSLDELPQIWNILVGQMSIVGPRPALWNQDDLIAERDKYHANDVRPGLTGFAQVNGRDELPVDVKAKLDGKYIENLGFVLDTKIFFSTIANVFKENGVVEGEQNTSS